MRMRARAAGGLLIVMMCIPASAMASEQCAQMLDRFADQMDEVAARYKKAATKSDECEVGRKVDVPTQKRILEETQAKWRTCDAGRKILDKAKDWLASSVRVTEAACKQQ